MATIAEVAEDTFRIITPYLRALREHDVTGVTEWNPMREPPG
jgi:hypothetical protein